MPMKNRDMPDTDGHNKATTVSIEEQHGEKGVSRFISASDGLRLHYVEYGSSAEPGATIVCLPGLTRTADDFSILAPALRLAGTRPGHKQRRILALDYRGRGLSDHDKDWQHYTIPVELDDILSVLTAASVERAIIVGTSRGGLHAMAFAALRPALLQAVVLNDIGPEVDSVGLMRIKNYVGKMILPKNWQQAADMLKTLLSAQFTSLSDEEWHIFARMTFVEKDGGLQIRYDPALANTLQAIGPDMPVADLWPQFRGLAHCPVLVLRGASSDLLSRQTFAAMQTQHPACTGYEVAGQGHAPLLIDQPTIRRIADFMAEIDH